MFEDCYRELIAKEKYAPIRERFSADVSKLHNGYFSQDNAVKVERSVYDYVVYDSSTVEKPFTLALDRYPDVKMFFKIPERFKIETPIGTYNPDWAV